MTTAKDDLPRWRDSAGDPGGLGARAADLVDVVRGVPPLAPEVLARIERRVLSQRPARPGQRAPLGLRLALLAVVVLASVATAKGTVMLWRRHLASVAPRPPISRRSVAPARHPVPAVAAIPAPAPAPPAAPIRPAPRRRRSAMVAPRVVAPPARTEAQLLAHSLSVLRQAHDAAGALSILDEYARAFPHGVLEAEAFSARLEAVLQLHDRPTALRLLDARSDFAGRLGSQQLLTRAELRASAGRYPEAVEDFDGLLAPPETTTPADAERALYGRAVCLGHLGRDDRARADLSAYQRRFPGGKYAAEVARLLAGTGPGRGP